MDSSHNKVHDKQTEKEIIVGRIVAVDFSGEKTLVSFECDRRGPWRPQLAALVIEKGGSHD